MGVQPTETATTSTRTKVSSAAPITPTRTRSSAGPRNRRPRGSWTGTRRRRILDTKGIELRGADADEAPPAYKRLDAVLAAQGDTIRILHRLQPIGVAMAGPDIYDPFKD
jgi:hypothetical protein